ncbi:MAG: hypothetical protein J5640_02420 [Bacteroidales bacterium]|nr:hypothetical protein [Bacteroidales bacterium]
MAKSRKLAALQRKVTPAASVDTEMICRAVAADFKLRGITHAAAAEKLLVEPRSVSNQISGKRPFGKKSAQKYAATFGYDEAFLLYGTGSLKKEVQAPVFVPTMRGDMVTLPRDQWERIMRLLEKAEERELRHGSHRPGHPRTKAAGGKHPKGW